jgi:glycosyltransferase involved in cell wall biosynthesis
LKLVLVGPTYPYRGGIAHYTTMLYRALAARDHQVWFYSFKRLYPRCLFPGRTDRDPSKLRLDARCEYTLDSLNPLTWWATARAIRMQQPETLILQWWVPFFAPMWAVLVRVARRAGIKVLFVCHNVLPHEQRVWDKWLTREVLGPGDGFVVHSQEEKALLLDLLPGRRVEAMPLPVPVFDMLAGQTVTRDEARRRLGLPQHAPVLLFFGFVREYKGLRYLLEAVSTIRSELAEVRLLVVGEFWQDKQSYLDQIGRLGIEQSVIIVDQYVSNEDMPVYFAAGDVAVLPYTHVTQSAVAQLAFAFGLPVITTRVGGLAEVVADGETGLLVSPSDGAALAEGVKRYFREELKAPMTQAIKLARCRFEWSNLVVLLEEMSAASTDLAP